MKHASMLALSLCMAMGVSAQVAAQAQTPAAEPAQARIYGSELMTPQERNAYQARMRAMNTEQEREAFRLEHHRQMQERARAQGKTLPDMPPSAPGMGAGPGMGPGMGQGGGMGPGPRR